MQRLVYLLIYPFLWGISRLPFRLLYLLSDGLFLLLYVVIGYRRKVVRANLQLVFPNWTKQEIRRTEKAFYAHMCDMFLEMIKTMGIRNEAIVDRFTFTNLEVIRTFEQQGRSILIVFPHYASWEWALALNSHIRSKGYGTYQPINNPYFDQMVRAIRARFGLTLITTKETRKTVAKNVREGVLSSFGLISDQSPMFRKAKYWGPFMNIEVPMHVGAEEMAKQHDLPVVFLKVQKVKRGYYRGSFVVLAEHPTAVPDYGITDAFFRETEKSILEAPEYYFWTHRRWKHRNKKPTDPESGALNA